MTACTGSPSLHGQVYRGQVRVLYTGSTFQKPGRRAEQCLEIATGGVAGMVLLQHHGDVKLVISLAG